MKRYLLFAGMDHDPRGGWEDFVSSFDTQDEAMYMVKTLVVDWWQIVDSLTSLIVSESED